MFYKQETIVGKLFYSINMNFGKLLAKLNNDIKTQVRHLEKLKKKLIKLRWSKCFYETCQKKKNIYISTIVVIKVTYDKVIK